MYKYQPLDGSTSIRLLTLLPSQDPYSDIEIKLSITPLDEAPDYEALSYTWATSDGDTSISSSVICEGARIMVTRNCVDFLRLLRRQGHERVLWMDAIVSSPISFVSPFTGQCPCFRIHAFNIQNALGNRPREHHRAKSTGTVDGRRLQQSRSSCDLAW